MQDEIGGIKISDIDAKPIKVPGYATFHEPDHPTPDTGEHRADQIRSGQSGAVSSSHY